MAATLCFPAQVTTLQERVAELEASKLLGDAAHNEGAAHLAERLAAAESEVDTARAALAEATAQRRAALQQVCGG